MRLIDGHALMERLQEQTEVLTSLAMAAGLLMAQGDVLNAPTIDAVPVVRCEDCRMTRGRDEHIGQWWCLIHRGYVADDYYCADGKRREE